MSYKVPGLSYINSQISNKDKTTPQEVILKLKDLIEETKEENIFISIKKNYYGNYILFYKKKFHQNTSIIVDYLPAIMQKQYQKNIIYIFDSYYQELAKKII